MKITQVKDIVNAMAKQVLGDSAVVNEDLSNIVEIGQQLNVLQNTDVIFGVLADQITRIIFVDRKLELIDSGIIMDNDEYGAIVEKVACGFFEAQDNDSWNLQNNQSYDPNVFYEPSITGQFWNSRITFEIVVSSVTGDQLKSAFRNLDQLNALFSMVLTTVNNSMTVRLNALILSLYANMIALTVKDDFGDAAINTMSGAKAVNVLKLYNDAFGLTKTAKQVMTEPEFYRYAITQMALMSTRFKSPTKLLNIAKKERFTNPSEFRCTLLDQFVTGAKTYLQSDTYNKELLSLPEANQVSYWQGVGTGETAWSFEETSKIVVTPKGETEPITVTGIIGIMRDVNTMGINTPRQNATSNYNARGQFLNQWFKYDAGYFNATDEQFVVFFVA